MLDVLLLLVGDIGIGKDLLVCVCYLCSLCGKMFFFGLNCVFLFDDVVESELFGYVVGVYFNVVEGKKGFFEQVNGGLVLLDEIGEMLFCMQIKLLCFFNDGIFCCVGEEYEVYVDVWVICVI